MGKYKAPADRCCTKLHQGIAEKVSFRPHSSRVTIPMLKVRGIVEMDNPRLTTVGMTTSRWVLPPCERQRWTTAWYVRALAIVMSETLTACQYYYKHFNQSAVSSQCKPTCRAIESRYSRFSIFDSSIFECAVYRVVLRVTGSSLVVVTRVKN